MAKKYFKIVFVAGARPNFMKIAALVAAFKRHKNVKAIIVHTGQHYDKKMSKVFFDELKIPKPDVNLEVGSGTHAVQTGKIMIAFNETMEKIRPDLVVVVGDVNSTIACSLVAKKFGIKVAHVEAGLRSFDWSMPEEINRVLTDRISDFLFCTEKSAVINLKKEGITKNVYMAGNVMIDTLLANKKIAQGSRVTEKLKTGRKYAVLTLHRPSNVDEKHNLSKILGIIRKIADKGIKIIFPVHPRTRANLRKWALNTENLILTEPLGYLDFLKLISHSTVVLTDSGGIQEETTILGVPCLTIRENTERPVTVTEGTNQIVGTNEKKIISALSKILRNRVRKKRRPQLWDGKASDRITKILLKKLMVN